MHRSHTANEITDTDVFNLWPKHEAESLQPSKYKKRKTQKSHDTLRGLLDVQVWSQHFFEAVNT